MYNFVHVLLMLNGKNCRQHHNCVMFEANVMKGRHKKNSRNDISLTSCNVLSCHSRVARQIWPANNDNRCHEGVSFTDAVLRLISRLTFELSFD